MDWIIGMDGINGGFEGRGLIVGYDSTADGTVEKRVFVHQWELLCCSRPSRPPCHVQSRDVKDFNRAYLSH